MPLLKQHFGSDLLRVWQEEIIRYVLAGRDVVELTSAGLLAPRERLCIHLTKPAAVPEPCR